MRGVLLFFFLIASSGSSRRCFVSHRDQMHVALSAFICVKRCLLFVLQNVAV